MRTADLKKMILKISGSNEFYGYDIHRYLTERNVKIGIGRLYAVLAEMKDEKLLEDRWETSSSGPKRRIYHISKNGEREREKILLGAIRTVHDFYTEYLMNLPPEQSAFEIVGNLLTSNLSVKANVAFVASRFSEPIRRILAILQTKITQGNLFVIGERTEFSKLKPESISFLDGTLQDIPTKSGYLDLLIVTGNIRNSCLNECMIEWRRVLTDAGVLAVVTPTALVSTYADPLTIGDFVEQYEHPRSESHETPDKEALVEMMKEYFVRVEAESVVHITVIRGSDSRTKMH